MRGRVGGDAWRLGGSTARRLGALGAVVLGFGGGARTAVAQEVVEFGPQVTATAADPASVTGGGYVALRTLGRTRFALTAGAGVGEEGDAAWRAELTGHFLLNPRSITGVGAYLGGGVAAADAGDGSRGYLVLLAGVESRPAARSGWALEVGLGGGLRVSAGWRWRMFPPNWRFRR